MFIELIDRLRCPAVHRDSWLVARMDRVEDRDVVEGSLGCPVCHAEYEIHNGVVWFADAPVAPSEAADSETAMQLAAGLGLVDASKAAVLEGGWGAHAPLLRALSPAQMLLINPPAGVESGGGLSIIRAVKPPLANASVDAAAIDPRSGPDMRRSMIAAVRGGGRILGRGSFEPADGLTLLRSTESLWIAEASGGSAPVTLRRA